MFNRHSSMMLLTDTLEPCFSRSASMYHPQLYTHTDTLDQHQIDRLSKQYNSSINIQQLLTCSSLSTLDCKRTLQVKINSEDNQLPISPPLSPLSSSTNSFSSSHRTSFLSSSLSHKPSVSSSQPYDDPSSTLSQYPILITHIHKSSRQRLCSFLGHSIILNKTIRLDQDLYRADPRFYHGQDQFTLEPKLILKLVIIKSPPCTVNRVMAPFGIHFANSAILPVSTSTKYASIPDTLVLEALYAWLAHAHLPHLSHACHIMRDGIKLYIVFDPSVL